MADLCERTNENVWSSAVPVPWYGVFFPSHAIWWVTETGRGCRMATALLCLPAFTLLDTLHRGDPGEEKRQTMLRSQPLAANVIRPLRRTHHFNLVSSSSPDFYSPLHQRPSSSGSQEVSFCHVIAK